MFRFRFLARQARQATIVRQYVARYESFLKVQARGEPRGSLSEAPREGRPRFRSSAGRGGGGSRAYISGGPRASHLTVLCPVCTICVKRFFFHFFCKEIALLFDEDSEDGGVATSFLDACTRIKDQNLLPAIYQTIRGLSNSANFLAPLQTRRGGGRRSSRQLSVHQQGLPFFYGKIHATAFTGCLYVMPRETRREQRLNRPF